MCLRHQRRWRRRATRPRREAALAGAKPSSRVCLHRPRRRPATKARRESVLAGATTRSRLCLHRPLRRQTTRPRREALLLRRRHTVRLLLQERPSSRMCPHRQRQGPRRATTVRRETLLLLERGPALACACTAHGGCLHRPRGRQATVARTEVALAGARPSPRVCRYRPLRRRRRRWPPKSVRKATA